MKQKTKNTTKMRKKKQYELTNRRFSNRKRNESNKGIKQNERRQKRQNIIDEGVYLRRFFVLATSDKNCVTGLNLHKLNSEILVICTVDFQLNGLMIIGPIEHKTNFIYKNMEDFESYINAIVINYGSEDVKFTGYVYILNTHHSHVVKRSAYRKGANYMQEIVEDYGKNCYILTSGNCFIKCNNYFTKKDYTEDFIIFIRTEIIDQE